MTSNSSGPFSQLDQLMDEFAERRGKLSPEQIEELKQFETEADTVLSQPPGDLREE